MRSARLFSSSRARSVRGFDQYDMTCRKKRERPMETEGASFYALKAQRKLAQGWSNATTLGNRPTK